MPRTVLIADDNRLIRDALCLFKSRKDLPVELVVEKGAPNLMQHVREMIPV